MLPSRADWSLLLPPRLIPFLSVGDLVHKHEGVTPPFRV